MSVALLQNPPFTPSLLDLLTQKLTYCIRRTVQTMQPAKLSAGHLTTEASGDLGLGLQPSQVSFQIKAKSSLGVCRERSITEGRGKKTRTEEASWQFWKSWAIRAVLPTASC